MTNPIYTGAPTRLPYSLYAPKAISAVSKTDGTLTSSAHGFSNGQPAYIRVTAGSLPTPFLSTIVYFIVGVTTNTLQLANTPGGSAIVPTDVGSGFIEVLAGVDPSTVSLTVEAPDGTELTYTYAGATVSRAGVGIYYKDYTPALAGPYTVRYDTTGPAAPLQYTFSVVPKNV